jgi:hypothetical protein
VDSGPAMFARSVRHRAHHLYSSEPLAERLREVFDPTCRTKNGGSDTGT